MKPAVFPRDFQSRGAIGVYLLVARVVLDRRRKIECSKTTLYDSNAIRLANTGALSVYQEDFAGRVLDVLDHDRLTVQVNLNVVRRRQLTTHFEVVDQPEDRERCVFG